MLSTRSTFYSNTNVIDFKNYAITKQNKNDPKILTQPKPLYQISTKFTSKLMERSNAMSNLPLILIDNELTTIYHRNKRNIRIEFSISDHKKTKTETKSKQIKIVEYLCVHRQNMPIVIISIEIIHLSKFQNQYHLPIFQKNLYIGDILQTNESIILFISCRLKLISWKYIINHQNKIKMFLLFIFVDFRIENILA